MADMKKYEPFFGEWYIERLICENNVGGVYEIRKRDGDESPQAMKVIHMPDPGLDPDGSYAAKLEVDFVAEINMMTALQEHINVTAYKEFDVLLREGGVGWDIVIRMEMLTPVPVYIRSNPFTIGDALLLGADVCAMLEFCHPHDIVHRNICPQNIFVSEDGVFKVGDFAIEDPNGQLLSVLSEFDAAGYTAPEVYHGEKPTPAADIYSLGMLLYGLLNNNRLPFMPAYPAPCSMADIVFANEKRFRGEEITPPKNAGDKLSAIILKACSYEPSARYTSAAEMKAELNAVLYNTDALSPPAEEPPVDGDEQELTTVWAPLADSEASARTEAPSVDAPTQGLPAVPVQSEEATAQATADEPSVYEPESDYTDPSNTKEQVRIAPEDGKKKKSRKRITAVLVAILVFAVVCAAAFGVPYVVKQLAGTEPPTEEATQNASQDASQEPVSKEEPSSSEILKIPALNGMNAEDAELLLKGYGFKVKRITEYSPKMDKGFVIAQSPAAQTRAKTGDTVTITVSLGAASAPVTGIALDKPTAALKVGETLTLKATIAPPDAADTTLTWSSATPSVASVTRLGLVTAHNVGTAVITVANPDGSIKTTCTVTVTGTTEPTTVVPTTVTPTTLSPTAVTGVQLSAATLALEIGKTATLTAGVQPSSASVRTVTWTSSNTAVATVTSAGLVSARTAGTATITVTTTDGGFTAVCRVTVTAPATTVPEPTTSNLATVPAVYNMTRDAATAALRAAGFQVAYTSGYSVSIEIGNVMGQTPAANSSAARGSTVSLVISEGCFTVTLLSNNEAYGTVSSEFFIGVPGESFTVTAAAAAGYHFVRWNDGSTEATRTITLTADNKTYTAVFEAD